MRSPFALSVAMIIVFQPFLAGAQEGGKQAMFQPWGGADLNEWVNAGKATVLTDMSGAEPKEILSASVEAGKWKVLPYEMTTGPNKEPGYKGKMIWTSGL